MYTQNLSKIALITFKLFVDIKHRGRGKRVENAGGEEKIELYANTPNSNPRGYCRRNDDKYDFV